MAINKKLIHFKNFSDFNSKKLSANETNTAYRLGVNGSVTVGEPDILYQSICWIKDVKKMWTHDTLYECDGSGETLTEADIAAMGFTKNTGTYSKPSGGIPKSDLASAVQTSLGKADTALQSHQDISGKQDKLVSGTNIKTINGQSVLGNGDIVISGGGSGTITEVKANGTSIATSGTANIPAASTSVYGVTKLTSSTSSTSTTLAATASAVKTAYDLANTYIPMSTADFTNTSDVILYANEKQKKSSAIASAVTFTLNAKSIDTTKDNVWSICFSMSRTPYNISFITGSNYTIMWANGVAPTFEAETIYEVTFKLLGNKFLGVCGAFKTI